MFEVNFSNLLNILFINYLIEHFRLLETFEDGPRRHNLNSTMSPSGGNGGG